MSFIKLLTLILAFLPGISSTPYPQEAGRLRVGQSPSNRLNRSGNANISTPIPSSRLGHARTPMSGNFLEEGAYESDIYAASPSTRLPAYQVTRVPSSPVLPRPSAFYDPVMEQQFIESDPFRTFSTSYTEGPTSTETTEYDDSALMYLETQSPPPFVDDLPERKRRIRRKRSESRLSINDAGSEMGEEYEDAADAALASYPRSSRGPIAKKKRHMTEDERLESGRAFRAPGRDKGKRSRNLVDDDARSETSQYERSHTPSKRRRLIEQELTDREDDVYDEPMQVDSGDYSESEWATGPSPLRRRSSSSSHYSAQGDRNTMSRTKSQSSTKRSRSKSRRSLRADTSTDTQDDYHNGDSGMDVSAPVDDAPTGVLSHSPSSVKSLSNLSNLANAPSTGLHTPRMSVPATPGHVSIAGSVAATPAGSVVPSTNPSPTKTGETNSDAIPLLTSQHSGVFGVPLPSTPSSLLATSARNSRLQNLRDLSHNIASPSPAINTAQTPTTSTNSISRIPLSYSASKRSLEPPVVSFTPVADVPTSPRATTPELPDSSAPTAKDIPLKETVVVSDVSEPEEDNRINHLLTNALQRKEDKEVKIKQAEQKEKEKQELLQTVKAGPFKSLASATATSTETSADAPEGGDKPALPKFGAGFKAPTSTAAGSPTTAAVEGAPKPAFTVPGATGATGEPKKPLFGAGLLKKPEAPAASDDAASPASIAPAKPSLFGGLKPAAAAPADGATTPSKPSLFGGPKPAAAAPADGVAAPAPQKPSLFGALKAPVAQEAAQAEAPAPTATGPKFGTGGFTTPSSAAATPKKSLFGASPSVAAPVSAPAAAPTGLFGGVSSPAAAAPAPSGGLNFGASKPAGFGSGAPSFGATKPAAATPTSTAPTGLFGGGAAAPKPGFGSPAPVSAGGMMTSPDKPVSAGGFGASSTGGFGASSAAKPAPSGLFGGGASSTATNGGSAAGGFGASAGGGFGATKPATSGGFGAAPAATGGFNAAPAATGGFNAKPTGAAAAFGAAASKPAPSGLFGGGASTAAPTSAGAGFGASKPATGGFGAAPGAGFGTPTGSNSPAPGFGSTASAFGASKPATTFGGSPAPTTTGGGFGGASAGFGAKPAAAGFGSPAPSSGGFNAAPASGGFGNAPSAGGFGAGQSAGGGFASSPAPTGLFGGSGSGTSSPAPSGGGFPTAVRRPVRRR